MAVGRVIILNGPTSAGKSTIEWVDWWVAASDGIETLWVGVAASPESIQQRERARGDRVPGMALAQSRVVHGYVHYELVVDSDRDTPSECARKILSAIRDQHVTQP